VHRSDQSKTVGDVKLLLPGLSVLGRRHRTAPVGAASPLYSHCVERHIIIPGVAVSGLCTVGRVMVFIPTLSKAKGIAGRLASLSIKILNPLAHNILDDVADVSPVLAVYETVRNHKLILVVARPRDWTAVIAPRISDTLSATG
jgi:hypothetical protein